MIRPFSRAGEWAGGLRLPAAAALTILFLLTVAAVVLWATGRPQGGDWWDIHYDVLPWKERLTIAGAVAAGAGAAVALVVGYRKQRDAEDGKFAAAFSDAAAQLGDEAPAVRMAGAYALAALADRYRQHRQQCIDALCAYLRLPYDPDAAKRNVVTITRTEGERVETTVHRANDREVRLTIIRIVRDHLRDPEARTAWCRYDLDFTGAIFDGGDFSGSTFSGGRVSFERSTFSGGRVSFERSTFSGGRVWFGWSTFSGGRVWFGWSTFSGGQVSVAGATFSAGEMTKEAGEPFHGWSPEQGFISR